MTAWGGRLFAVRHRTEELAVALGLPHLREQELHAFDRRQGCQDLAQHPDPIEVVLRDEQFFFARAALLDVDRREHAAIRELAIEMDLEVAGALELLED